MQISHAAMAFGGDLNLILAPDRSLSMPKGLFYGVHQLATAAADGLGISSSALLGYKWIQSYDGALAKKAEVDHSKGELRYVNFEGWFAYRFEEHDKRFGSDLRERDWFETKPR